MILVVVFGLTWQAGESLRTHRATAIKVLQDYARLVGDEFTRKAMAQIGYYGYYAHINAMSRNVAVGSDVLSEPRGQDADDQGPHAARLANFHFLVEPSQGQVQFSQGAQPATGVAAYLAGRARDLQSAPMPESGFIIDHAMLAGKPHTLVLSTTGMAGRVFGFCVDRSELAAWLQQVFADGALLPASLADGKISNASIFLRFVDNSGAILFESRDEYDPTVSSIQEIGDDYSGIFAGYSVVTGIDPAVSGSLVIGGLPRSRIPLLMTTALLAAILLVAAIRLLRREYALMKMRGDFVSEISHELRTPLTQIRMFTETLLLERFTSNDEKRRALEIVNRESQRLSHLVENVLRFSARSSDVRELKLVRTKLAPLIDKIVTEFAPLVEPDDVRLTAELDVDAEVSVDADAVRQILINLLDNAAKYGPKKQTIRVSLQRRPQSVCISVCDQGPGVPMSDRDKIWGAYYRLERERQSAIAGTGIGLAVVHELVARHGGSAWMEDNEDGGACFMVEFPQESAPQ